MARRRCGEGPQASTMAGKATLIGRRRTTSAMVVVFRGFGVHDDEGGTAPVGGGHEARGGVDRQGRPDGQQQIAGPGGAFGPFEVLDDEVLPEADGGRLQDPGARARRPGPPCRAGRPHRLVRVVGRRPWASASRRTCTRPLAWCRGSPPLDRGRCPLPGEDRRCSASRVCPGRRGARGPRGRGARHWAARPTSVSPSGRATPAGGPRRRTCMSATWPSSRRRGSWSTPRQARGSRGCRSRWRCRRR